MSATVFITGITGFAGSHLAELCLAEGFAVAGLTRDLSDKHVRRNLGGSADRVRLFSGDVARGGDVSNAVQAVRPDLMFHLAGCTSPQSSNTDLLRGNVEGTLNVVRAAAAIPGKVRLLLASSSAVYGLGADGTPITETAPLAPTTPYGLSKAAQDVAGRALAEALDVDFVCTRAFNHTGPRERDASVISTAATQLVRIRRKKQSPELVLGNLSSLRDFSDVRDIVRGYLLALTRGKRGAVYNLASGRAVRISDIIDELIRIAGVEVTIRSDTARLREGDVPVQVGDASRAASELAWRPEIEIGRSLRDVIEYCDSTPNDMDRSE